MHQRTISPHAVGASAPFERRQVLIVEDERAIRRLLRRILEPRGFVCHEAEGVSEALEILKSEAIDLVLSDIELADGDGLDLVRLLKPRMPALAVLMVTSTADTNVAIEALERGAYGYITKPFQFNEIVIQVDIALRRRDLEVASQAQEAELQRRVREATEELRHAQEEIALRLMAAGEYRDNETGAHIRRIGLFSAEMARLLGWSEERVDEIRIAAPMHDVGKMGTPDAILQKKGPLTPEERTIMKRHASIGFEILSGTHIPLMDTAARIALCHHEHWDGNGYPAGLVGEAIPIEARIVAVCDVYDALTQERCYKPAWPIEKALATLRSGAGTHFDPTLVALFIDHIETIKRIAARVVDIEPTATLQDD